MSPGDEGVLTLSIKMKVSPEPDSCQLTGSMDRRGTDL